MYHFDDSFDMLNWRVLQNSMPQIEDMPGPSLRPRHYFMHMNTQLCKRRKQRNGIQVALHRRVFAQQAPALIQRDTPIQTDDVATGPLHRFQ